jgi:hypothetical protein
MPNCNLTFAINHVHNGQARGSFYERRAAATNNTTRLFVLYVPPLCSV